MSKMDVDQNTLDTIVKRVLTVVSPDKIILYGSAATGTMTRDSDIDLLLVGVPEGNRHDETFRVEKAIGDVKFAVDIKFIAPDSFEATKNIIGGIAFPANKYGKVLYESA